MARQRMFGMPAGKQKSAGRQLAKAAGTAAAIMAPAVAVPLARKAAPVVRKAGRITQGAGEVIGKGEEIATKASDVMETASNVKQAVSSHSSTIGKVGGLIAAVARGGKSGGNKPKLSHLIEQHADLAVPRSVAYNQWTQLEMFPTLTKGIESVEQTSDEKAKWTSKIGPSRRTWTGKIVEQVPDERIAWKSEGGASLQGVVTFHSLDIDLTRVLLQMEYKPTGPIEWMGNTLRIQRRRAKRDLRLFKHFVEMRGEETGAWRGRIDGDDELRPTLAGQGGGQNRAQSRSSRSNGNGSRPDVGRGGARDTTGRGRGSNGRPSSGAQDRSKGPRRQSNRSGRMAGSRA